MGIIISAFPGLGKTEVADNVVIRSLNNEEAIYDIDVSEFEYDITGEKNPNFVEEYCNRIMENKDKYAIVFITTHEDIRNKLKSENVKYLTVIPNPNRKEEFDKILTDKGSKCRDYLIENWITVMKDLAKEDPVIVLEKGFLIDAIDDILNMNK